MLPTVREKERSGHRKSTIWITKKSMANAESRHRKYLKL